MNTAIHLMYRDRSNHKWRREYVLHGEPTVELEARLRAGLRDGDQLNADQVG